MKTEDPVPNRITRVNFPTKKKQIKENINEVTDFSEEVYKETWTDLKNKKMIKLSEIKDFDVLYEFN